MANTVDKVLSIAEAEVGYLEKKSNQDLNSKSLNAGYNNYTKYGYDMHKIYPSVMDFPASWCDCFVDWCFYKAYGKSNAKSLLCGDFNDYTVISAQLYKNKNAWYKTPKVGDQIFFKNTERIYHTGLVYKVDSLYVYTIEGNTSSASGVVANGGCVAKKKYLKTYSKIAGYGRPKYDLGKSFQTPKKDKTITEIAQEVIDGKWGSGEERKQNLKNAGYDYNKVQDKVNELAKKKETNKPKNIALPTLRKGSKGIQVKYLQQNLNHILNANLKVDGELGGATANAIKQFQDKYKLCVDGVYGKASYSKMVSLLS